MAKTLVVDDQSLNLRLISYMLNSLGHASATAVDGQEAIHLLERGDIDLLITDIRMPRMNGWDLLRHVRRDARFRDLSVVAYTAASLETYDAKCATELGLEVLLLWPFSSQELEQVIGRYLVSSTD